MRIRKLHIENFGKLHGFDFDLQNGLNLICADNGWGKTTLAMFVKAMFYGLAYTTKRSLKENERKKYLPWQGGAYGGSLEFEVNGKCYRAERFFGTKDKEDTFSLYSLETGLESTDFSEHLGEELFHLDRAAFERSSFFVQQDFSVSANDSLNARLTHAEEAAGDMLNYEKAVSSLEKQMKFYQKTGGRGELARLAQRRRELLLELEECGRREAAVTEWQKQLTEKKNQEKKLLLEFSEQEKILQAARDYQMKAAKKSQYELLKSQADQKEEELQLIGIELARFEQKPPTEEVLDKCRENIYHLRTLLTQAEAAKNHAEMQNKALENANGQAARHTIGLWLLAGALAASGLMLTLLKRPLTGGFLLLAGFSAAFWIIKREQQAREQRRKLTEAKKTEKAFLREADALFKKADKLKEQICQKLHIPETTAEEKLEARWKLERQRSQEYSLLKQKYATQRQSLLKSREAFKNCREAFTDEELAEFRMLRKPDREMDEIQQQLSLLQTRRENLQKEQHDIENQIHILSSDAERIPELEEELNLISQKLEEGSAKYSLLEKTSKYLKMAREQFSARYLEELRQGFNHYLRLLEPEMPMETSLDVKLEARLREAGALRSLDFYSAGWQDLVQIAERLAIVDALYKEESPILLMDDPFVNLDSQKQKRAMELLKKLAQKWQIIYFTCRS